MTVELNIPAGRLREVARALKAGLDDLQEADSGWFYVDFDHPAFGRDAEGPVADRIPGEVIAATDEPGDEADALVVAVGYEDSFTGDVHLGNGMVVPGATQGRATPSEPAGEFPDGRLPAVALFEDGGRGRALIGTLHQTRDSVFDTSDLSPQTQQAIGEWLEEIARGRQPGR